MPPPPEQGPTPEEGPNDKPVIFNSMKLLRSGHPSIVVTKALQNGWPLLRSFTVLYKSGIIKFKKLFKKQLKNK